MEENKKKFIHTVERPMLLELVADYVVLIGTTAYLHRSFKRTEFKNPVQNNIPPNIYHLRKTPNINYDQRDIIHLVYFKQ